MQDMGEISAIVNEKIVIKCRNFQTLGGGTSLPMALGNKQTDRSAWILRFIILDRQVVSGSCSFGGEVVHADADATE